MNSDKLTFDQIVDGKCSFLPSVPAPYSIKRPAERIVCVDGESLSVQVGSNLYCAPKNNEGPYTEVEVGFPSVSPPDTWARYFEGDWETDDHTGSVYAYVPVALVREFIEAHSGEVYTVTDLDALRRE